MTNLRSAKETAEILGVTVATLSNWRAKGKGPKYSLIGSNRKVSYALEDIEYWVKAYKAQTTAAYPSTSAERIELVSTFIEEQIYYSPGDAITNKDLYYAFLDWTVGRVSPTGGQITEIPYLTFFQAFNQSESWREYLNAWVIKTKPYTSVRAESIKRPRLSCYDLESIPFQGRVLIGISLLSCSDPLLEMSKPRIS